MMQDLLRALVPRDWTGEQALFAARLLRAALDAVWAVHGEIMAESLGDCPVDRWNQVLPDDDPLVVDDIPF
jgi:hypothetical protein